MVDFNYETTIKANIKRFLSSISSQLLLLLATHASNDNNLFQKLNKDFMDIYPKLVRVKKIKKSKENLNLFCSNMNKNLEVSIYIIKQFSNTFFKTGYFKSIHNILFEIFLSIDTYTIGDIGNIIINGILFYLLHNTHPEKKATTTIPSMISIGGLQNSLAALGFLDVPAPYLPKLPENLEKTTYTLALDLDETLVHFFMTPSGGSFLIRPYCFKFLEDMSKIFEVTIFTAATKDYADSILDIIDPNKKLINHRLYRQHISIREMCFVKDLSKLGRNLNRCLIIDNLAENFKFQQNNGIQCSTWNDDMKDTQLYDLDIILTKIIEKKPQDIKPIIKKLNEEVNKKMKNNANLNPFKDIDVNKLFKQ
jgi:Dullard-like phosphatase family protein